MTSFEELDCMNGVRIDSTEFLIVSQYMGVGSTNPSSTDAHLEPFSFLTELGSQAPTELQNLFGLTL